ncbi:hypothetical protein [Methylobacterium platani]|uniref:hypothetical protein n=1 Tax=Methylobacterium platani TaxID=427683 RepID=UPI0009E43A17|nr:hypothetical protein [Methylobacterium platani]
MTTDNGKLAETTYDAGQRKPKSQATVDDIAAPRLTPQGRESPEAVGEDDTDPNGGTKTGQPNKAEG